MFGFAGCDKKGKTRTESLPKVKYNYPEKHYDINPFDRDISNFVKDINPNKDYDYWRYTGSNTFENGNKELRNLINLDSVIKLRSNFFVGIKNNNVEYFPQEHIRDFIGDVDNLDEALLIANSYNFIPNKLSGATSYYIQYGTYILNLENNSEHSTNRNEIAEVTITKDGFTRTRFIKQTTKR